MIDSYNVKPWYLSKGVIGGIAAAGAGLAGIFGYTVEPEAQTQITDTVGKIVEMVPSVVALFGGLLSAWGRIKATKAVK